MDARLHGTLSDPVFGDARYERLASISNGHLYKLRQHKTYRTQRGSVDKIRPVRVQIGERRKPAPAGKPGYLRVDTVHQGDLDGIKGLYLINAVDEVTQFQAVLAVAKIRERVLLPVLQQLLGTFPSFLIIPGDNTKNGTAHMIVLNSIVRSVVEARRGKCKTHVFSYHGNRWIGSTIWRGERHGGALVCRRVLAFLQERTT